MIKEKNKEEVKQDSQKPISLMRAIRSWLAVFLKGRDLHVKVFSCDQARSQLATLIKQSAEDGIPIVIQCSRNVSGVLVDSSQWNEIQDTLYLISLRKKLKEEFSCEGNPLEEAMKELGFSQHSSARKEKTDNEKEGL